MDNYDRLAELPKTVAEAADWLDFMLTDDMKREMRQATEAELPLLRLALGAYVRQCLGPGAVDKALLAEAGAKDAEGVSAVVIEALWRKLGGNSSRRPPASQQGRT